MTQLRLANSVVPVTLHAQTYPSKPIRIVVSFAAGGPTDTVARIMGAKMAEFLGQPLLVENKAGAGGNIGADVVAKAPPDGYTLLMATVSTHAINPGLYKKIPYDPVRDFAPVGQVGVTPIVLAVNRSVPAHDVKTLIALLKANPGKYSYGSSGLGSILHLCGEAFKSSAGGLDVGRAALFNRLVDERGEGAPMKQVVKNVVGHCRYALSSVSAMNTSMSP